MKSTHILLATAIIAASYTSCKKENNTSAEDEKDITIQLSQDQAVADNITEDVYDMFLGAAENKDLMGNKPSKNAARPTDITGLPACATVTVSPAGLVFPKTIVIDFGVACTSITGIVRSGKINIVISDSVRKTGSTATVTFDNYHVNLYKVEGTIVWTNISSLEIKSWTRTVTDGKITAPGGRYWLHSGTRKVVQTAGATTPKFLADDIFSITEGTHTVTNAAGESRTSTIIEPLQKKTICENIDKGAIKVQGPEHYAIIDFGDGTCDKQATIAFDGGIPVTFLLR